MAGHVSDAVIRRLPGYYRHLRELESAGVEQISSQELGERMHLTPSQIRQDINCFGGFGRQGYGYKVSDLKMHIGEILGLDREHTEIIVGAGNIGCAIAKYPTFQREGFRPLAMFDNDPEKIGVPVGDIPVYSMEEMPNFLKENMPDIAVLALPRRVAQEALDKAKSELSYLEGYQSNASAIETKKNRIDELNQDYINADGTAGTKTMEEATAYIEDRISQAQDMVNDYAAKKAAYESKPANERAVKTDGQDAEILLNGATFTADSNTFEINGLTITCKGLTTGGEKITLTTENDVSGIYDMIKGFIKEYGELINEMDKLYNADSAKGYDPLTDDEKDSMSESEVEKWETKIKDSLLRRDSTLNTVSSAMKEIMASGFSVNGKTMYLSDFGIETLGYFTAADNEKNAYHINGDADDDNVKSKTNTLQEMISTDPDSVVSFFTQLGKSMNAKLKSLRGRTEFSSINTVYDDRKMKEEYDNYTTKIKEAEEKLQDYEDKWYKKFSAMETALAKLQSNSSAVTSLLGGS